VAAAETDSDVIVVHAEHMKLKPPNPDFEFAQSILDLAAERGIVLALENGPLGILSTALDNLKGLGICLDTGHVYFTPDPLKAFVDRLRKDICHLHIQEKLGSADHYVPGTGDIPLDDWNYLLDNLKAVNFSGAAVLEIRPRDPLLNAQDTKLFFDRLLSAGANKGS
jgi:sugar phosphate isomerase/epimerase